MNIKYYPSESGVASCGGRASDKAWLALVVSTVVENINIVAVERRLGKYNASLFHLVEMQVLRFPRTHDIIHREGQKAQVSKVVWLPSLPLLDAM